MDAEPYRNLDARRRLCLSQAEEAQKLAAQAGSQTLQEDYLRIARNWVELSLEIERLMQEMAAKNRRA